MNAHIYTMQNFPYCMRIVTQYTLYALYMNNVAA